MKIDRVRSALPANAYDQEAILAQLEQAWAEHNFNRDRLRRLHQNVLVGGRRLALPIERYRSLETFGDSNDEWIAAAVELGSQAVAAAIEEVAPESLGALYFVTVTGVAVPSIEARIMNRLRLPTHLRRVPIFGLGCVAGAAGIARVADDVRAHPHQASLLLSVELCSLTLQRRDLSIANLIASGLFGDGAAAVLILGSEHPSHAASAGPCIVDSASIFFPDSERVMGWEIDEHGFQVVLSADVPAVVAAHLPHNVDRLLARHGLSRADVATWIAHPGGPKVLEAMQSSLGLPDGALDLTWDSLREVGNLSSTSVLLVLEETLRQRREPDSWGLLLALGPGFCAELVLLRF
ncbi:MAG: type III polyketide synthase [Acidobacteria bacterium]|nr:MAG: type III polyketide synthase [Acidobacteriota bacterium]REJ99586.1 MAG: type III polyketide synthase [Acidobacteriota bacterium]